MPLLLYVVGVGDPHVAIGTSALAVAVNAFANLAQHARAGTVKWGCASVFAASGVVGAYLGSSLGKAVAGDRLLVLFALVMVAVGIAMLRGRADEGDPGVHINRPIAVRLIAIGFITGTLSGFFGIGGGFLIVPGIMLGSGMPVLNAIGSSLFSVGMFGTTTALNYARSALLIGRSPVCSLAAALSAVLPDEERRYARRSNVDCWRGSLPAWCWWSPHTCFIATATRSSHRADERRIAHSILRFVFGE